MDYGKSIREARKKLDLTQQELVDDNLSRNLLSNIEVGKTKLVPQKALALYLRILEISWTKSIKIDIEFDELLENDVNYKAYKKANFLCGVLKDYLDNDINISYEELVQISDFSNKSEVGLLSYHLNLYAARNYIHIGYEQQALKSYTNALNSIKWFQKKETLILLSTTLAECLNLLYDYEKYDEMIHYYEILKEFQIILFKKADDNVYFNLGLFYKNRGNYSLALKNMNIYIDIIGSDDKDNYLDALLVKASILTSIGEFDAGINLYFRIVSRAKQHNMNELYIMSLSNIIFTICNNNIQDKISTLENSMRELVNTISMLDSRINLQKSYSSLAQGYRFLEKKEQALFYFKKSFDSLKGEYSYAKEITLIDESFETYLNSGAVNDLIPRIVKIKYSDLDTSLKNKILVLMLKLYHSLTGNMLIDQYYTQLGEYIKDISK